MLVVSRINCDFNSLLLDRPNCLTVSVTESWLNSSVTNPMIDTSGRYVVHRNDRLTKQGGGVLCLVTNKDWPSHTISLPEKFSSLDIVAVTVCTDVGPIRYYPVFGLVFSARLRVLYSEFAREFLPILTVLATVFRRNIWYSLQLLHLCRCFDEN